MTQSHATLIKNRQASLNEKSSQLEALSPLATLKRGYAIVSEEASGKIVRNSDEITEGEKLGIRLSNGALTADRRKGRYERISSLTSNSLSVVAAMPENSPFPGGVAVLDIGSSDWAKFENKDVMV